MYTNKTLIAMMAWACNLLLSGAEVWAWQTKITTGWANAVALDAAGDVFAAGVQSHADGKSTDFTVAKFDGASGQELWRRVIIETGNAFGQANALAVDAIGNLVVVGKTNDRVIGWDFN